MNSVRNEQAAVGDRRVEIARGDLQAAWAVLENLAVSMDQIGGYYGDPSQSAADRCRAVADALSSYLSEDLIRSIGEARTRLARYIPDTDAESLVDAIPYWDYRNAKS